MTSAELAATTGLHERWVREWLRGQAAAHLVDYRGEGRFALSPEAVMVLADEQSPAFAAGGFCGLPQQMSVLDRLPESFRTGRGLPYDAFGLEGNRGVERMFAPWFRTMLVPVALPRPRRRDRQARRRRAAVADVGCGAGVALIEMAKALPALAVPRLRDLEVRARARGGEPRRVWARATSPSTTPTATRCRASRASIFVTTFDCLHDMANPAPVIAAIRQRDQARRHVADRRHQERTRPSRATSPRTRWPA